MNRQEYHYGDHQDLAVCKFLNKKFKGLSVLYHGTRHISAILADSCLRYSCPGEPTVSFSRSPAVASKWARLERDVDERIGAVLVFDRTALSSNYRLEPFCYWRERLKPTKDELEERVFGDVEIKDHLLLGIIILKEDLLIDFCDDRPAKYIFQQGKYVAAPHLSEQLCPVSG